MSRAAVSSDSVSSIYHSANRLGEAVAPSRRRGADQHIWWPSRTRSFPGGRRVLQVVARVGYPASLSWWKKGEQHRNMLEINSSDQFYDALGAAARKDKLVVVNFFSAGCRSCKALHPKICQLALENPDVEFLTINFHDNLAFCRGLGVNVLPFFHFYRGSMCRIDAFSCSLSKIEKLRAAVLKHQSGAHFFTSNPGPEMQKEVLVLPSLSSVTAAACV